jgi:hypothetical protein
MPTSIRKKRTLNSTKFLQESSRPCLWEIADLAAKSTSSLTESSRPCRWIVAGWIVKQTMSLEDNFNPCPCNMVIEVVPLSTRDSIYDSFSYHNLVLYHFTLLSYSGLAGKWVFNNIYVTHIFKKYWLIVYSWKDINLDSRMFNSMLNMLDHWLHTGQFQKRIVPFTDTPRSSFPQQLSRKTALYYMD